jgi:hypothetical protein
VSRGLGDVYKRQALLHLGQMVERPVVHFLNFVDFTIFVTNVKQFRITIKTSGF